MLVWTRQPSKVLGTLSGKVHSTSKYLINFFSGSQSAHETVWRLRGVPVLCFQFVSPRILMVEPYLPTLPCKHTPTHTLLMLLLEMLLYNKTAVGAGKERLHPCLYPAPKLEGTTRKSLRSPLLPPETNEEGGTQSAGADCVGSDERCRSHSQCK